MTVGKFLYRAIVVLVLATISLTNSGIAVSAFKQEENANSISKQSSSSSLKFDSLKVEQPESIISKTDEKSATKVSEIAAKPTSEASQNSVSGTLPEEKINDKAENLSNINGQASAQSSAAGKSESDKKLQPQKVENKDSSLKDQISTSVDQIRFGKIKTGQIYNFHKNRNVEINFSKLDQNIAEPDLQIKQVQINYQGKKFTGYEFKTNMQNGQFKFDLNLPYSKIKNPKVVFSEDGGKTFKNITIAKFNGSLAKISDLDHFTIFAVINPNSSANCNATVAGSNPGTTCFATIQEAINAASAGDTILVGQGTYSERILIDKPITLDGNSLANLNFVGDQQIGFVGSPSNVTIKNFYITADNSGRDVIINDDNNTCSDGAGSLDNLTIHNNAYSLSNRKFFFSCSNTTLTNLSITNNDIFNISTDVAAIDIQKANNVTITGNTIEGSGRGIQLDATTNAIISNNNISYILNQGIQVADVFGPSGNIVISNNRIDTANTSRGIDRGAIRLYGSNFNGPITISGNDLNNSFNGIATRNTSNNLSDKNITITENTITNNINAGIRHHGPGAFQPLTKNIFYGNNQYLDLQISDGENQLALSDVWDSANGNFYGETGTTESPLTLQRIEDKITHNCNNDGQNTVQINGVTVTINSRVYGDIYDYIANSTRGANCDNGDNSVSSSYGTVVYALNTPPKVSVGEGNDGTTPQNAPGLSGSPLPNTKDNLPANSNNSPANDGPAHNSIVSGTIPVNITVSDSDIDRFHFRIIADGETDNPIGCDFTNQSGFNVCGYIYSAEGPLTGNGLTNQNILNLDTTLLPDGEYWLIVGGVDKGENRTAGNRERDPKIKITVSNPVDLQVVKTANKTNAQPGELIEYSLNYQNLGSAPAINSYLVDSLPDGLQFVSAIQNGQQITPNYLMENSDGTTTIFFDLGQIAGQAGGEIKIIAKVTAEQSTTVTNEAYIDSSKNDPNTENNLSSVDVEINVASSSSTSSNSDSPDKKPKPPIKLPDLIRTGRADYLAI